MLVEFLVGLEVIIINISKTFIGFQHDKLEIESFGLVSRIQDMGSFIKYLVQLCVGLPNQVFQQPHCHPGLCSCFKTQASIVTNSE